MARLALVMAAALQSVSIGSGHAQDYPTKPIRMLVGFPAGSAPALIDVVAGNIQLTFATNCQVGQGG